MADRKQIGWVMNFLPIYAPEKGAIVTRAFILCVACGGTIATHGGPVANAYCFKCVEELRTVR